jgi:hypothetical protein
MKFPVSSISPNLKSYSTGSSISFFRQMTVDEITGMKFRWGNYL